MSNKISIAWYSWYAGKGYKGEQLNNIILTIPDNIGCCYGLAYPRTEKGIDVNVLMNLSKIPVYTSYLVRKLSPILGYPNYFAYKAGYKTVELLYAKKLCNDDSNIVYTNYLAFGFANAAKKANKILVIEAGVMHPEYTAQILNKEYKKYQIKSRSIYTDNKYIKESLKVIEMADKIIVLSQNCMKTYLDKGILKEKLKLISLLNRNHLNNSFSPDKPYAFICTAHHSFIKATHRLLEAYAESGIQNMPLLIVGTLHDDLKEYVNKNGPFKNVQFLGTTDISKLYIQYNAVGILISFSEGMGRSVSEYLSYGFPCIVSPAVAEVIEDGINGFLVNPLNKTELIEKLNYFSQDYNRINQMHRHIIKNKNEKNSNGYKEIAYYLQNLNNDNLL